MQGACTLKQLLVAAVKTLTGKSPGSPHGFYTLLVKMKVPSAESAYLNQPLILVM